jgi:hypothetical protein
MAVMPHFHWLTHWTAIASSSGQTLRHIRPHTPPAPSYRPAFSLLYPPTCTAYLTCHPRPSSPGARPGQPLACPAGGTDSHGCVGHSPRGRHLHPGDGPPPWGHGRHPGHRQESALRIRSSAGYGFALFLGESFGCLSGPVLSLLSDLAAVAVGSGKVHKAALLTNALAEVSMVLLRGNSLIAWDSSTPLPRVPGFALRPSSCAPPMSCEVLCACLCSLMCPLCGAVLAGGASGLAGVVYRARTFGLPGTPRGPSVVSPVAVCCRNYICSNTYVS